LELWVWTALGAGDLLDVRPRLSKDSQIASLELEKKEAKIIE
jgi:hypothetical protein